MTKTFAYEVIFFIKYYNLKQNEDNILTKMLDYKEVIIYQIINNDFFFKWVQMFYWKLTFKNQKG